MNYSRPTIGSSTKDIVSFGFSKKIRKPWNYLQPIAPKPLEWPPPNPDRRIWQKQTLLQLLWNVFLIALFVLQKVFSPMLHHSGTIDQMQRQLLGLWFQILQRPFVFELTALERVGFVFSPGPKLLLQNRSHKKWHRLIYSWKTYMK